MDFSGDFMKIFNIIVTGALFVFPCVVNAQALEKDQLIEWLSKPEQTQAMYGPFPLPEPSETTRADQRVYAKQDCTLEVTYGARPKSGGKLYLVEQAIVNMRSAEVRLLDYPGIIRLTSYRDKIKFNTRRASGRNTSEESAELNVYVMNEKRGAIFEALQRLAKICAKENR